MRKVLLLVFLFLSLNALANDSNDSVESLQFEAYWSGFRVGEMQLIINRMDDKFTITNIINSQGIAKLASKYASVNVVSGIIRGSEWIPKIYNSKWKRKKQSQDITLEFSDKRDVIQATLIPPEREGKRPEVGQEFRKSVYDPVTAAIVSRETIRREMAKNPKSQAILRIPVFDAKRRFDVICAIKGYKMLNLAEKQVRLLHINLRREPLAGYDEDDLREMREEQQTIDFYLDENFNPAWGVAKAQMGSATIKLVR